MGKWSLSSTADYITMLVHLGLTGGAPPPAMKDKVLEQSDLIHLQEAHCRHSVETTAFSPSDMLQTDSN